MPPRYSKLPRNTYQLRVALKGTRPPIWRRFQVSPSMKLSRLHVVLQVIMGWDDSHLHMFTKGRRRFMLPNPWMDDVDPFGGARFLDERKCRIGQLLTRENDWIEYEYDFGDSWHHRITLQKILPRDPAARLPVCISGKRRCPPEDSGGVWGFHETLAILADPDPRSTRRWRSGWTRISTRRRSASKTSTGRSGRCSGEWWRWDAVPFGHLLARRRALSFPDDRLPLLAVVDPMR